MPTDFSKLPETPEYYNLPHVGDVATEIHDPAYAQEHDHFWVSEDGDFGTCKPLSLGPRSHHSYLEGRAPAHGYKWGGWPKESRGEYLSMIRCKTLQEAAYLSAIIACRGFMGSMMRIRIEHKG